MTTKMVSPAVAITAVGVSVLLAVFVTSNALAEKERSEHVSHRIDMAYCTSCHSDAKTLRRMKEKEGPCGFLFGDKKSADYLKAQLAKEKAHPEATRSGCPPVSY